MKRAAFLFVVILLNINMMAQNYVSGTLIDSINNEKLMFVNVGLLRVSDSVFVSGTSSNENGYFEMTNVKNGEYDFFVSSIGYETLKRRLKVEGNVDLGIIKIKPGVTMLEEVVITEKKPLFANEGEKVLYNVKEDPTVQIGTLSDALQNTPGVEVDVEGNVSLRGVSSVEIWINDQPARLDSESLKTYLQQMPASAVEKIEVISNPSARYASKSDGGIINIVTNSKIQNNQFLSFGTNFSTRPHIIPWVSYVWSNDKISYNIYANFNYGNYENIINDEGFYFADSPTGSGLDTVTIQKTNNKSSNLNLGGGLYFNMDYNIDSMNNVSFWTSFWPTKGSGSTDGDYYRKQFFPDPFEASYSTNSSYDASYKFLYLGAYYLHKFNNEGHNISFTVSGGTGNYGIFTENERNYVLPYNYLSKINTDSKYNNFNYSFDVDYNIPYSKNGEISVGAAYSRDNENDVMKYDTLSGDSFINDIWRSYDGNYISDEMDVYVTVQHKFGNFVIKPGLRMEYANLTNKIESYSDFKNNKEYLNWRPTLHLSYRTKSMHNFSLSYSRRISNPNIQNLTDYIGYDETSMNIGNMDLIPTTTNSIEGSWNKYWDKFGSVGLSGYYRFSNNSIDNVSDVMYDGNVFGYYVNYSQPVNVGESRMYGLEANVTYRPNAMFNMRLYANLYDSYYKTVYKDDVVSDEMLSYSLRLNLWTKLWNKLEVHASGFYRSPTQGLYSERKSTYMINCGLRADFFKRKLSAFLNVSDIFNWNKYDTDVTNPYYHYTSSYKWNSRFVSVGVVLRFGKMELENRALQGESQGGGSTGGAGGMR